MNNVQSLLLRIIGAALFGGDMPAVDEQYIEPLLKESKSQAVYSLLFNTLESQIKSVLSGEKAEQYSEMNLMHAIACTRNFDEHGELHELMTSCQIPYVVIKGLASAMYYPEPSLRNMGDVDFLVDSSDMTRAGNVLEQAGFAIDHGDEDDGIHVAYTRPPMSIWEMHRSVNGVPSGEIGELIEAEIGRTIETAAETTCDGVLCRVPDRFHHGLIMLLHTASHLTSEGVGLRHLCDWVVFVSDLSDAEFREIFEKKLKEFGLWKFAQVLTLLGIKYLGAPKRVWAIEAIERKSVSFEQLESLMNDILSGGNFGFKDMNRYREIKYISDRGERTVSSDGIIKQGFRTLNKKVFEDYKTIDKHRFLLPIGYLAEGGKYFGLLITGKRKSSGTKQMLREAAQRKKVYSSLRLFENNY